MFVLCCHGAASDLPAALLSLPLQGRAGPSPVDCFTGQLQASPYSWPACLEGVNTCSHAANRHWAMRHSRRRSPNQRMPLVSARPLPCLSPYPRSRLPTADWLYAARGARSGRFALFGRDLPMRPVLAAGLSPYVKPHARFGATPLTRARPRTMLFRQVVATQTWLGETCPVAESEPIRDVLHRWRAGDETAADEIYQRYAKRLLRVAERLIDRRLLVRFDADDVVQSVFRTFFGRLARGEYSFDHSGAVWQLLVRITINKVRKNAERHRAGKRNPAYEIRLSEEVISRDPTPEAEAILADELERLLDEFAPAEHEIVHLCVVGAPLRNIVDAVGCSQWTVRRVRKRLRSYLQKRLRKLAAE